MKTTSKPFSIISIGFVLALSLIFTACEKAKVGPKGATGATGPAGPGAKTYIADLTYNTGSVSQSFTSITDYESNDAILCYLITAGGSYVALPTSYEGIKFEIVHYTYSGTTGAVQVNTYNASDGYSSPWGGPWTMHYKIVHIKSSGMEKHPNVDYSNYEDVKEAFDL